MAAMALAGFMCFLAVVLAPDQALAWGPGVHLAASRFILSNLDLLPAALSALLSQFPQSFLYGSLSADFFIGKGSRIKPGHSHNWESGLDLLDESQKPHLLAYAHGYLSHLAADVVAHNFYVPNLMARTPAPGPLTHIYVEVQADSRLTAGLNLGCRFFRPLQRDADKTLLKTLRKNTFSFKCRKRLFKGTMALAKAKTWNRSLRLAQRMLPLPDDQAYLQGMFELSLRSVLSVLSNPQGTVLLDFDPIGSRSLAQVTGLRPPRSRAVEIFPLDGRLTALPALPEHHAA